MMTLDSLLPLDSLLKLMRDARADLARHVAALLVTLSCFAALWFTASQPVWLASAPTATAPIQLMLEEWVAPTPPAPPVPATPPAATPPQPREIAAAAIQTPLPAPNTAVAEAITPVPVHSATPPMASTAPVVATPPAPPAEPVKPTSATFEAEFIARVRALLNAGKRYPTGREASMQRPQGKARVWFILTRNGSLVDSGIQDSSNSLLLDGAALATVRRAEFSAFPNQAWPGQEQHRFSADLEFLAPSS
jgi:protein TonB